MYDGTQELEVRVYVWALIDKANKKIVVFFRGTDPQSGEAFASTGRNNYFSYGNDKVLPASNLFKDAPGVVKASNLLFMTSCVKGKGPDGKLRILIPSISDQIHEFAQREDLDGYDFYVTSHSLGTTISAKLVTDLGLSNRKFRSFLSVSFGTYRVYSEETAKWMTNLAPGPWVNIVNGNDPITFASTFWGSLKAQYLTNSGRTDDWIANMKTINSFGVSFHNLDNVPSLVNHVFQLPGNKTLGFITSTVPGMKVAVDHLMSSYVPAVDDHNWSSLQELDSGLDGLLRFIPKSKKPFSPVSINTKEANIELQEILEYQKAMDHQK